MIRPYDLTAYTVKTFHDIPISMDYHVTGRNHSPEMIIFKNDMKRRFINAMRVTIREDELGYTFTSSVPEIVRIPMYVNNLDTAISVSDIRLIQTQSVLLFDVRKYNLQMKFSPTIPTPVVRDFFVNETKRNMANGPFNSWLNKHLFIILARNVSTREYNWPIHNVL